MSNKTPKPSLKRVAKAIKNAANEVYMDEFAKKFLVEFLDTLDSAAKSKFLRAEEQEDGLNAEEQLDFKIWRELYCQLEEIL